MENCTHNVFIESEHSCIVCNVIEISITTMIELLLKNVSSVNESHLVLSQIKEVDGSVLI